MRNGATPAGRNLLEVLLERQGAAGCLALCGDLEPEGLGQLERELGAAHEARVGELILDLRGLTKVDPEALSSVLEKWIVAEPNGMKLILVRAPERFRLLFEQTGMGRLLPVAYDRERSDDDHG